MLHFVVEVTYTAPLEQIDRLLAGHRAFLQTGYDRGLLLMSGPQTPRVGGFIVARAASRDDLVSFFRADPFQQEKAATYKFTEFNPVKRQPALETWCTSSS